ncbi:MAG: L-2-amino-thiazoline-4-carboxylic acid hydrolase [Chloroflexi bacterium]|nr:L-2-amino-thiazoline-4-carboxylic acid hydrolase [Chloroflexota bacterium]
MTDPSPLPPDHLNEIGVLKRREIEARILGPMLEALGQEFGHDRVRQIARDTIVALARQQGDQLAAAMGGRSLAHLADSMDNWTRDDALRIDVLQQNEETFSFNVTRCRYADMYRALGLGDLGALLSCNRDYALVEGFSPEAELTRTQTIMQGATHCDFRYRLRRPKAGDRTPPA